MWSCLPLIIMTGAYLGRNISGDVTVSDTKSAEAKSKSNNCQFLFFFILSKNVCRSFFIGNAGTKNRRSDIQNLFIMDAFHWRTSLEKIFAVLLLHTFLLAVPDHWLSFTPVKRLASDPLPLTNNSPGNAADSHSVPWHANNANLNSTHKYDAHYPQIMSNQSEVLRKSPCLNITLAYICSEPVLQGIVQISLGLNWCWYWQESKAIFMAS